MGRPEWADDRLCGVPACLCIISRLWGFCGLGGAHGFARLVDGASDVWHRFPGRFDPPMENHDRVHQAAVYYTPEVLRSKG